MNILELLFFIFVYYSSMFVIVGVLITIDHTDRNIYNFKHTVLLALIWPSLMFEKEK